jgi:SPP1 family predicted phage head-tail adaptor
MTLAIGRLRHRLTLEAPSRTPDGAGGVIETWTSLGDVWAAIVNVSGREAAAARITGTVTHEIWLRPHTGIATNQRLRLGARIFHIHAVLRGEEPARRLRCLCEERDL